MSSDDIVERLRVRAAEGWFEHDETCCPDCADDVQFGRELVAAANEIERLRALTAEQALVHDAWLTERSLAEQLAGALLDGPFRGTSLERRDRIFGIGWADVHDALDKWQEARRE